MKTTAAHPTSPATTSGSDVQARPAMVVAASSMVWQLAVVVLLPIFGGAKLDDVFNTGPVITVIGFALGAIGMGYVVWRQMKLMSPEIEESEPAK